MRDYERRISFYNRYFVFKKVRAIDNAELVVKSLLGTSTAFEKQMAALEQEQADLDKVDKLLDNPATATAAKKPATADVAVTDEKKKPGKNPKIQLIVKEQVNDK
jgi:hypothetical protein